MKKILVLLCALGLAVSALAEPVAPAASQAVESLVEGGYITPAAATAAPVPELPPLREDPMLQQVVEIAHRIDMLAENDRFMKHNVAVQDEVIEAVSYGDHARPVRAFHLAGQQLIDVMFSGVPAEQRPDFTRPELLHDLVNELPEMLWASQPAERIPVLGTLARYKIFALPGAKGCGIYVLQYKEGAPVLVTWYASNDCVNAAAWFMPDKALAAAADAAAVSAWFAAFGLPAAAFEEVPLT